MNKLTIMLLSLATFMSSAFAADQPGDKCSPIGAISQTAKGYVLSCVDSKWKKFGTTPISINVNLMEGDKLLHSSSVTALDGETIPVSVGKTHQYTASAMKKNGKVELRPGTIKEGFSMELTPTLTNDGKIKVEFSARKSELISIKTIKQGDLEIQLPEVSIVEIQKNLTVNDGKAITIPFGSFVQPQEGTGGAKYTILLSVATHH